MKLILISRMIKQNNSTNQMKTRRQKSLKNHLFQNLVFIRRLSNYNNLICVDAESLSLCEYSFNQVTALFIFNSISFFLIVQLIYNVVSFKCAVK